LSYADYDQNTLSLVLDLASLGDGTLNLAELVGRQPEMFAEHGYRGEADIAARLTKIGSRLAQLLEEQDCKPHLTRHDGTPHLHYARDGAPFAQWAPTMAVAGLVLYVCRNGRSRLRRCAAADCGRWFADTSRNSSRRYCEHACASRTTVAAFRERQRRATAGTMQG
jgi:predicted RNA-binding Zn ribbon-like protein